MAKKRKGRGIDHVWELVKYKHDAAIYSRCKCGFRHQVNEGIGVFNPERLYPYCPNCGARKKRYIDEIKKLDFDWWDEYE